MPLPVVAVFELAKGHSQEVIYVLTANASTMLYYIIISATGRHDEDNATGHSATIDAIPICTAAQTFKVRVLRSDEM